ncbi:hypothetical protein BsWGS_17620 [Bradybaena similaris]
MAVKLEEKRRATNSFKSTAKEVNKTVWEVNKTVWEVNNTVWEASVTHMGNDGALHRFWNFHRKMKCIITDKICPNIVDISGNSLQTEEEKGQFLKRYLAPDWQRG